MTVSTPTPTAPGYKLSEQFCTPKEDGLKGFLERYALNASLGRGKDLVESWEREKDAYTKSDHCGVCKYGILNRARHVADGALTLLTAPIDIVVSTTLFVGSGTTLTLCGSCLWCNDRWDGAPITRKYYAENLLKFSGRSALYAAATVVNTVGKLALCPLNSCAPECVFLTCSQDKFYLARNQFVKRVLTMDED